MKIGRRTKLHGRKFKAARRAWRRNAKRNNGVVVLYPANVKWLEGI